ncbi:MAG: ATP synthase F1 subunit epsilon [Endomicrobiaceae bacterium]|nr:ATP synthase F1 subunit epsilon [Endomicrobiaceae bacterium]
MANIYKLDILSPEGSVFGGNVKQATFPTTSGLITILAGHTSLITTLAQGDIEIVQENDEKKSIAVSGGFLEVSDNMVSVVADFAVRSEDIDDKLIEKAKLYADEQKKKKENINSELAERELQKAIMALKVLEHNKLKRKNKGVKY